MADTSIENGAEGVEGFSGLDDSGIAVPEAIHGDPEKHLRNPLADDQVYTKLKRNKFFEACPSVLHFSGFVLNHVHQQVVKIVNISQFTKRLHILPCQSPYFNVQVDKKGKVGPGMSEDLVVQFTPLEWRYYYDCIRIHSEDENLLIPIHAYPTVAPRKTTSLIGSGSLILGPDTAEYFPAKVDFGNCRLTEFNERNIPITCHVPVEFEYSINVVTPHPDMDVEPKFGRVPPQGQAFIKFTYTPSRMVTAEMIIEVNISQFGFKPKRCSVIGSAGAGSIRNETIKQTTMSLVSSGQVPTNYNLENYAPVKNPGEGRIDLFTVHDQSKGFHDKILEMRASRIPGQPIQIRTVEPPPKPPSTILDGLVFPDNLRPRASTQFVLNQVVGKLSWKELKKQMEDSGEMPPQEDGLDPKAKAYQSIKWYETTRMQPGGFLDIEEEYGEDQSLQICEFKFGFELRMREEYDRAKEVKWFPAIGDDPPTQEEIDSVHERRADREHAKGKRERERLRLQTTTVEDGAKRVIHVEGELPAHNPTFDPYLNDAWTVRKEVTDRFRREMHKLIIRNRVARRIAAVHGKLELLNGGASAQLVDSILAADSAPPTSQGQREDNKLTNMRLDKVVTWTFPVYRAGNFRDRQKVEVSEIEAFEDWDYVDLKVPQTCKLMNYKVDTLPSAPVYVAPEQGREMRSGAEDEQGLRGPRGFADAAPQADLLEIPKSCVEPPAARPSICRALDIKNRPNEGRDKCLVHDPLIPNKEVDGEFALRPYVRVVGDKELELNATLPPGKRGQRIEEALFGPDTEAERIAEPEAPGMNTVRCLRGQIAPLLSSKWLPKRELSRILYAPLPGHMDGPDAADEQSDEEEGAEPDPDVEPEPEVVIPPPTPQYIRENFKIPKLMLERKSSSPAADGAEGGEEQVENLEVELDDMATNIKIPLNHRAQHEKEMEDEVVAQRRKLEERLPAALRGLNDLIADPRKKLPIEPSVFQPSTLQWLVKE